MLDITKVADKVNERGLSNLSKITQEMVQIIKHIVYYYCPLDNGDMHTSS
jgi:hypothetical protein